MNARLTQKTSVYDAEDAADVWCSVKGCYCDEPGAPGEDDSYDDFLRYGKRHARQNPGHAVTVELPKKHATTFTVKGDTP